MSGNVYADVSDHLPNFIFVNKNSPNNTVTERPMIRIYSEKNTEQFCIDMNKIAWDNLYL